MLLFVSGCSVDYNLTFKGRELSENIKIDATNSNITEEQINNLLKNQLYIDTEQQLYQIKQKKKKLELSQKYTTNTYENSPLLSQCYTAYNFIEESQYYDLTTSSTFTCNPFEYMYIDELKIKIKTNYKVLSHNADSVENNTYIWNITTENSHNKPIQIRFSKEKIRNKIGLIILGITVIITIIIFLIVMKKQRKNNQI